MSIETTIPRLIDANALKKVIETYSSSKGGPFGHGFDECLDDVLNGIDEMPTVETTDDVLMRIPSFVLCSDSEERVFLSSEKIENAFWNVGKTPLEAIKKLEASINPK